MGEGTRALNVSRNTVAAVVRYRASHATNNRWCSGRPPRMMPRTFVIYATLDWKTDRQVLLTLQDYMWRLVFQWLLRQCEGDYMMLISMEGVQEENHCSQVSTKLQDVYTWRHECKFVYPNKYWKENSHSQEAWQERDFPAAHSKKWYLSGRYNKSPPAKSSWK